MTQFKAFFEASETSLGNWPSHCLSAENLQDACDEALRLAPPVGAAVLKVQDERIVRQRFWLGL